MGGTVCSVLKSDPLEAATRLVAERFPDAAAAYLGGSVLTARRTATFDLDIVVLLDGPAAPFRETLRYEGWVVELFVQTRSSMRHYWDKDAAARRTPLLRMCAEGRVLVSRDGEVELLAAEATWSCLWPTPGRGPASGCLDVWPSSTRTCHSVSLRLSVLRLMPSSSRFWSAPAVR